MAGLFDGEGCVYIQFSRRKNKYKVGCHILTVSVTNTCYEVLSLFQSKFQGRIVNHPGKNKKCYRWTLSAKRAGEFLKKLYPHLIIKKDVASVAIELQDHLNTSRFSKWNPITLETLNYRESLRRKCKIINSPNEIFKEQRDIT